MDLLNADDLTDLALGRGAPRISLFLPTHRDGPSTVHPDRKSTRLNSSHMPKSRMPSSA